MRLLPRQYQVRTGMSESWWSRMAKERNDSRGPNSKRQKQCDPDEDDDCSPKTKKKITCGQNGDDDDGEDCTVPKSTASSAVITTASSTKSGVSAKTKITCGQNGDDDDGEDCTSTTTSTSTTETSTASSAVTTATSSSKSSVTAKATSSTPTTTSTSTTKTRTSTTAVKITSSSTASPTVSTTTSRTSAAPSTSAAGAGISSVNASQGISGTTEAILIVLVVIGIIIILPMIFFFLRRYYKRKQLEKDDVVSAPATPLYRTSYSQGRASEYFPDTQNMARAPQWTNSVVPTDVDVPAPLNVARPITFPRKAVTSVNTLVMDPNDDENDPFADPKMEKAVSEGLPRRRRDRDLDGEFSRRDDSMTLVDMRPGGRWSDPFTVAYRGSGDADQPGNRWRSALSWVRDQRGRVDMDEDVERIGGDMVGGVGGGDGDGQVITSPNGMVEQVSILEDGRRLEGGKVIYPGRGRKSFVPGGVI